MPLAAMKPAVTLEMAPGDVLVLLSDGYYEYENAGGEPFGEDRVEAIVAAHRDRTAAELLDALMTAVVAYAGGAPQQDDMTAVIVRREAGGVTHDRTFARSFAALSAIFGFTAEVFAREGIARELLPTVDFAVEELFTNMVKYSRTSEAEVRIGLTRIDRGVEVTLTDYDVDPFDVTKAPDADVRLPIEQRRPGGLGLHLIRRLVDSIEYEYSADRRESRIAFRKTVAGPPGPERAAEFGEGNAGH
jgi:anti-sigma regulatory factor (Ser/Thr protein kinase)